jgi:plastocyanin
MNRRRAIVALPLVGILSALSVGGVAAQDESASPGPAAGPTITVTGYEYAFGNLPVSVPAGTSLAFTNTGAEVHELIVARKNDGVTESWDELIALPEEESLQKVTTLGPLFAAPGEPATIGIGPTGPGPMTAITLEQEGEYIALCAIPQGMTELPDFGAEAAATPDAPASPDAGASPESGAPQGPPHFVLGMRQEFTVTAAGSSPGPIPSVTAADLPAESPAAADLPAESPAA